VKKIRNWGLVVIVGVVVRDTVGGAWWWSELGVVMVAVRVVVWCKRIKGWKKKRNGVMKSDNDDNMVNQRSQHKFFINLISGGILVF